MLTDYIELGNCPLIVCLYHPSVPSRAELRMAQFQNLHTLACRQYKHEYRWIIQDIAQGKLLPQLVEACFDLGEFMSTDYMPTITEYYDLKFLYNNLLNQQTTFPLRAGLGLFLNGLKFNPARPFAHCGFGNKVIQFHFQNMASNHPVIASSTMYRVEYFDVLDTFLKQPVQPFDKNPNLNGFFSIYPNLRMVLVDNRHRQRQISIACLQMFLVACQGLRAVKLFNVGFDNDQSVALAVLNQPCLSRLHYLVVHEAPTLFNERIDFCDILPKQFQYLRKFYTNLATRLMMYRLLTSMPIGAHYKFDFYDSAGVERRCEITRILGAYKLLTVVQNAYENAQSSSFTDLDQMLNYLDSIEEHFPLDHWFAC